MLLERIGGGPAARVTEAWKGQVVVCMATGPSLSGEQIALVKQSGAKVIAVNDAFLLANFADLVYFADQKWRRWMEQGIERPELGMTAEQVKSAWANFRGQRCTIEVGGSMDKVDGLYHLKNARAQGLSRDPTSICTGSNSGYQALNIATLAQPDRVLLIGYDAKAVGARNHFFGEHVDKSKPPYPTMKQRFVEASKAAKSIGVRVINCTPDSAIECFEGGVLADCL